MTTWDDILPGARVFVLGGRMRTPAEIVADYVQDVQNRSFAVLWTDERRILTLCNARDDFRLLRFDEDANQLPSIEVKVTEKNLADFVDVVLPVILVADRQHWLDVFAGNEQVKRFGIEQAKRVLGLENDVSGVHRSIDEARTSPEYLAAVEVAKEAVDSFMQRHGATEREFG